MLLMTESFSGCPALRGAALLSPACLSFRQRLLMHVWKILTSSLLRLQFGGQGCLGSRLCLPALLILHCCCCCCLLGRLSLFLFQQLLCLGLLGCSSFLLTRCLSCFVLLTPGCCPCLLLKVPQAEKLLLHPALDGFVAHWQMLVTFWYVE